MIENITYDDFKKLYPKIANLDCDMPNNIQITTHTLIYKFPILFNTKYIAEHIPMDKDFINIIKYGNSTNTFRSLISYVKKKSITINTQKKNKKRKNFYFKTTLIIIN